MAGRLCDSSVPVLSAILSFPALGSCSTSRSRAPKWGGRPTLPCALLELQLPMGILPRPWVSALSGLPQSSRGLQFREVGSNVGSQLRP